MPAINACLTRLDNPEVSISAVNIGFGIFGAASFTINGCQSTILSLISNGYSYLKIRDFSYFVGFLTLLLCGFIAWINPLNHFILHGIFNLNGDLFNNTLLVFRLLSFLPPFLVMEQLYVGIIMSSKSTNPIIYINICRLIVLIIILGIGIILFKNFESYGAIVGGFAWSVTLFFEGIFAWFFAKNIKKPL
jgi:Na+-driven multidrug efflux pump